MHLFRLQDGQGFRLKTDGDAFFPGEVCCFPAVLGEGLQLGQPQSVIPDEVHPFFQQKVVCGLLAAVLGLLPGDQYSEEVFRLFRHLEGHLLLVRLEDGFFCQDGGSVPSHQLHLPGKEGLVGIFQGKLEGHFFRFQMVLCLVTLYRRSGLHHLHRHFIVDVHHGTVGKHQLGQSKGCRSRLVGSGGRHLPVSIGQKLRFQLGVVDHQMGQLGGNVVGNGKE